MSEEQKEYAIEYIMQLQEENYKLQQENKQLKEEKRKAIEYNQIILDSDYVYSQDEIATKNLKILGDKE